MFPSKTNSEAFSYSSKQALFQELNRLIFPFLDLNSVQECKLVNKKWNSQVEKHYQVREHQFYKILHSYSSSDLSCIKSEEITIMNMILLEFSQSSVLYEKSTLTNIWGLREMMAFVRVPFPIEHLVVVFSLLMLDVNTWQNNQEWRYCYGHVISRQMLYIRCGLNNIEFLSTISTEKVQLAQEAIKKTPFDLYKLRSITNGSDFWALWLMKILKVAEKRLQLNDYAREALDDIERKAPKNVKNELMIIHKINEKYRERNLIISLNEKFNPKISEYQKRIDQLKNKIKGKDIEITTLKLAVDNLKLVMKNFKCD